MKKKITVGLLFGGKSAEHEVSLQSAKNVADAIDKKKYDVKLIGITKGGKWLFNESSQFLLNPGDPKNIALREAEGKKVALVPESDGALSFLGEEKPGGKIDVVFPILHGPLGEDGTVQGLLKLANVPFVGAGVLGSAVGMDKEVMKRLLREAGLPIGKFKVLRSGEKLSYEKAIKELGLPFFVKPANMGSSVGVSKVSSPAEYKKALAAAFTYDHKILLEEFIKGREIECAVLGNDTPKASVPGEIVVKSDFYSYESKYLDPEASYSEIPAKISKKLTKEVQELAVKVFQTLSCEGLGRVDFFLTPDGRFLVNEINTLPGFTSISMYPKMWGASGIPYSKLIDTLIQLALERFKKEQKLKTGK